jgi:D-tyrosyl-tRNA(Tyr) deacylase
MRIVIQRVREASVEIEDGPERSIGRGLVVFVAAGEGDTKEDLKYCVDKTVHLRIFPDADGNFDRSLRDVGGDLLVVPNFTLYGDVSKGRRPGFYDAMDPGPAEELFDAYVESVAANDEIGDVQTGEFGAMMEVEVVNAGPVTIAVDSEE